MKKILVIIGFLVLAVFTPGCGAKKLNEERGSYCIEQKGFPYNRISFYSHPHYGRFLAIYSFERQQERARIAFLDLRQRKVLDRITLRSDERPLLWLNDQKFLFYKEPSSFHNIDKMTLLCYTLPDKRIIPIEIELPSSLYGPGGERVFYLERAFYFKRDEEYFVVLAIRGMTKSYEDALFFYFLSAKEGKPVKLTEGFTPPGNRLSGYLHFFSKNGEDIVSLGASYSPSVDYIEAIYHLSRKQKKLLPLLGFSLFGFGINLRSYEVVALTWDKQGKVNAYLLGISSSIPNVKKLKLPEKILPPPYTWLFLHCFYGYGEREDKWVMISGQDIWIGDKGFQRFKRLTTGKGLLGADILQVDDSSLIFSDSEGVWRLNVENGEKKLVWHLGELFP